MLEIATARRILDGEPHFLQRDPSVIVGTQYIDARLLQRAEQAPLAGRFIVGAFTIVGTIPYRLVFEKLHRPREDANILRRYGLIATFQLGVRRAKARRLLSDSGVGRSIGCNRRGRRHQRT